MLADSLGPEPIDATPLSEQDYLGLIPTWLATRADLNLAEALNIDLARQKHFKRRYRVDQVLDQLFLRQLHKDMFGQVWSWAGKYRSRNLNLGAPHQMVAESVINLIEDVKYWIKQSHEDLDLIGVRFHHRLVSIHPFVNGNGRHARFLTDLLLVACQRPVFSWGGFDLAKRTQIRAEYINSLRAADNADLAPLQRFVRAGQADY